MARRCAGCVGNLMEQHDVCGAPKASKVALHFVEALADVDITEVASAIDEILAVEFGPTSTPTLYPPRSALQADKGWQAHVKKTMLGA